MKLVDEGVGVGDFTFEDAAAAQGFEIFVAPYSGNTISDERFHMDEPSGVRTDLKDIAVDGAPGIAFYGSDDRLHDIREVWFIHDGLLYEVSTFKSLDAWHQPGR